MNRFLQNRLFLQLLFTFIAAVCVATLSVVLITEAVQSAESVVVAEGNKTIATAIDELRQQYQYRASSDSSWSSLPVASAGRLIAGHHANRITLVSRREGGFYTGSDFLGYAFRRTIRGRRKRMCRRRNED